jgi:hypothetical protein
MSFWNRWVSASVVKCRICKGVCVLAKSIARFVASQQPLLLIIGWYLTGTSSPYCSLKACSFASIISSFSEWIAIMDFGLANNFSMFLDCQQVGFFW